MGAATMTRPDTGTVDLISLVASEHQIKLEPVEEIIDAHYGKRQIPGTGKIVRFKSGRTTVPADWMPLLERHPDKFLQRGLVGIAGQLAGIPGQGYHGPQVVSGAQATRGASSNVAPLTGWDTATVKQVHEWIATKAIPDLEQAWQYEMAHARRKMVVRALTDAMLGDDEAPAPEPEPIAASYTAPIPGEGGF